LPGNGAKNFGLNYKFDHVLYIANILNWCTCTTQDPCDFKHITLTDTPQYTFSVNKLTNNHLWSEGHIMYIDKYALTQYRVVLLT